MDDDDIIVDAELVEDEEPSWRPVALLNTWTTDGRLINRMEIPDEIVVMSSPGAEPGRGHEGPTAVRPAPARLVGDRVEVLLYPHEYPANIDLVVEGDIDVTEEGRVTVGGTLRGVTYGVGPVNWTELQDEETGLVPVGVEVTPADHLTHTQVAIQQLREYLLLLDDDRAELERRGDVPGLANGAADIALLVKDLATIQRGARLSIARVLDAEWLASGKMKLRDDGSPTRLPEVEVEGLGKVKVEGGKERIGWESETLLRRLIMEQIVTAEGDYVEPTNPTAVADRIFVMLQATLPLTASLSWKVGSLDKATGRWSGLRGQGIEPSDYCDEVAKPRAAKVPSRAEGSID